LAEGNGDVIRRCEVTRTVDVGPTRNPISASTMTLRSCLRGPGQSKMQDQFRVQDRAVGMFLNNGTGLCCWNWLMYHVSAQIAIATLITATRLMTSAAINSLRLKRAWS